MKYINFFILLNICLSAYGSAGFHSFSSSSDSSLRKNALEMWSALTFNRVDRLREICARKESPVNYRSEKPCRWTPLGYMIKRGPSTFDNPQDRLTMIKILVDAGADISAINTFEIDGLDNVTPIFQATQQQDLEVLSMLLPKGRAYINKKEARGYTPIMHAMRMAAYYAKDRLQTIKLRQCADRNIRVIELLLNNKADVTIKNSTGEDTLELTKRLSGGQSMQELIASYYWSIKLNAFRDYSLKKRDFSRGIKFVSSTKESDACTPITFRTKEKQNVLK